MLVVVAKLKAKEGKGEELERAFLKMIAEVRAKEEGTLIYILHRAANDPGTFLFYEKYTDQAAFIHHSATPHFKELFAAIGPLLEGKPSIETYEELAGVSR
ncbi:MAG: putative quinol monooxygenase [Smithellaceae bacterium]|nr:putative quinol monooxygenase [Smithellaceae bacterium]